MADGARNREPEQRAAAKAMTSGSEGKIAVDRTCGVPDCSSAWAAVSHSSKRSPVMNRRTRARTIASKASKRLVGQKDETEQRDESCVPEA